MLWDINEENMGKVVDEIVALNGQAFSYVCDVTKKEEVYETASKVKEDVGNVDILVNNAGVVVGKNFLSCSDKEIEKTMNVNLMAHFWVSHQLSDIQFHSLQCFDALHPNAITTILPISITCIFSYILAIIIVIITTITTQPCTQVFFIS